MHTTETVLGNLVHRQNVGRVFSRHTFLVTSVTTGSGLQGVM